MNQTLENYEKPKFGPDFGAFSPIWAPKFFRELYVYWYIDIVPIYHLMQFPGKLMNRTWENGEKPNFGHNFGPFSPNLGPQSFFCGF